MRNEDREFAETRWSDALSSQGETQSFGGTRFGNRLVDSRIQQVNASPERVFEVIEAIGGDRGWYGNDMLQRVRGLLDLAVGGPGLLRLRAEMKLPGRASLQFEVEAKEAARSCVRPPCSTRPAWRPRLMGLALSSARPCVWAHDQVNCRARGDRPDSLKLSFVRITVTAPAKG